MRKRLDINVCDGRLPEPVGHDVALAHPARITEVCVAEGVIFVLAENGLCAGYCVYDGRRLCVLNTDAQMVVRSMFHNKATCPPGLITVSVHAADHYAFLRCRQTSLAQLREGTTAHFTLLFTTEELKWPGFVEFDDVNSKVLTFSSGSNMYKVWAMAAPQQLLYSFGVQALPQGIGEVKISPSVMLLVSNRPPNAASLLLRILSIETGEVLRDVHQPIRPTRKVDILEQFSQRLLLKQEASPLRIVDLLTDKVIKVADTEVGVPSAFIYLHANETFLLFRDNAVSVWNFRGERLHGFEDHALCFPIPDIDHASAIYITQNQDMIISLCEDVPAPAPVGDAGGGSGSGGQLELPEPVSDPSVSIHISNIHTGKLVARVDRRAWEGSNLPVVTALYYAEETGDLITGDAHGRLEVWSS